MEFATTKAFINELRGRKTVDAKAGHTRDANEYEIRAAAELESLLFQLSARIGVARAESKEAVGG